MQVNNAQGGTQINCPNCHRPFATRVEQLIDVGRDPQAKARFLSGRTNLIVCPHCGFQTMLATPIAYHDPSKELFLIYIPMELNLPRQESEKLIGQMSNAVMNSLPPEQRKGYLFTPRNMLSLQGMVETILEADGITKDVIEQQRARMKLVETFLQTDPDSLPDLVQQHDAEIDQEFFAVMQASLQSALAAGRRDVAEAIQAVSDIILQNSSAGQELIQKAGQQEAAIQTVAGMLNELGDKPSYDQVADLALHIASEGGDEYLQVLVGLARPVLDYQFFQTLSARIDGAQDQNEKDVISHVRDRLLELTSMVDQQNEQIIRVATDTLRAILNSPDLDNAIEERLELMDDTFLAVLSANIKAAEDAGDINTTARLKMIFDKTVAMLRQHAPAAVQYINDLMQQDLEKARASLHERAAEFGPELVQWMEMLANDLASRGSSEMLEKLSALHDEAIRVLEAG